MANLPELCENCRTTMETVFSAAPRPSEVISGDFPYSECCFVRDEIRFLNNGRLIFHPDSERKQYCQEYFVICRKLVIVGGGKPTTLNPCGPDDPGNIYKNKNAITWSHRLKVDPSTIPNPIQVGDGTSFGGWSDQGQGNNGSKGGAGTNGLAGAFGISGRHAPDFTLLALEVEFVGLDAHLIIDFDGQVGGIGGRGQNGGKGGKGMNGHEGKSDTTWPGTGCDRQPGHGGDGGDGGDGGAGGQGGNGGNSGGITVISTKGNMTAGIFVGGKFSFVHDGGNEGEGGLGGFGGVGGLPGQAGFKTSECSSASPGSQGTAGFPPGSLGSGSTANQGALGGSGSAGTLTLVDINPEDPKCADMIPLAITVTNIDPSVICRGFSTSANNVAVTITGENLSQVTSVEVSLTGVTATIKPSSTDTQLDLDVDVLGNSALGQGDITLYQTIGSPRVLSNTIEVKRFEVFSISPTSAARGDSGTVTITGECFDPGAAIQQVNFSGFGITVTNVLVLDSTTIQCTVEVGSVAALSQRDVTVKTGSNQHTLVNAFTVMT